MGVADILAGYRDHSGVQIQGLNPDFQARLAKFVEANPYGVGLGSAYRSPERQSELFQQAVQKYGSPEAARKWVAPPGRSNHNHGVATDLSFEDDKAREWAHANAQAFGLNFPMKHEPWHVEPLGAGHTMDDGHNHGPTATAQPSILQNALNSGDPTQATAALQPQAPRMGGLVGMMMNANQPQVQGPPDPNAPAPTALQLAQANADPIGQGKGLVGLLGGDTAPTAGQLGQFMGSSEMGGAMKGAGILASAMAQPAAKAAPVQQLDTTAHAPDMSMMAFLNAKLRKGMGGMNAA